METGNGFLVDLLVKLSGEKISPNGAIILIILFFTILIGSVGFFILNPTTNNDTENKGIQSHFKK
jgi:hypothetical protein